MNKFLKYSLNALCIILLLAPKLAYPYQLLKFLALFFVMWQLMIIMNKLPSKTKNTNNEP